MINKLKSNISVVIPAYNFKESFFKVFNAVLSQKLLPFEIVVIDSSENDDIKNDINDKYEEINIVYKNIKKRLYPGEARNLGFDLSSCKIVAFLDSKTVPDASWLKDSYDKLINKNIEVVFGKTQYIAYSSKQILIRDVVYGRKHHVTTPGSLIFSKIFKNNKFIEGVRTVDDMYWRQSLINKNIKFSNSDYCNLTYNEISDSIISMQKRFFIYSLNVIKINIQNKSKDIYLSFLLLLSFLLVPRWNNFIDIFNLEFLYLPHITKIYFFIFIVIFIAFLFFKYLFKLLINFPIIQITGINNILIIRGFFISNSKNMIADWMIESSLYIPHITKIYLLSIFLFIAFLRGFLIPIKRSVPLNMIFPLRWIKLGFFGLSLDMMKAPGYLLGALYSLKFLFIKKR